MLVLDVVSHSHREWLSDCDRIVQVAAILYEDISARMVHWWRPIGVPPRLGRWQTSGLFYACANARRPRVPSTAGARPDLATFREISPRHLSAKTNPDPVRVSPVRFPSCSWAARSHPGPLKWRQPLPRDSTPKRDTLDCWGLGPDLRTKGIWMRLS
jgi:hypothetical protein